MLDNTRPGHGSRTVLAFARLSGTTRVMEDQMPNTNKAWRLHAHNDLRFHRRAIEAAALMQGLDLTAIVP
ncbi:MAG: hypothetical protein ACREDL_19225 [Bradyrhizobium sp.]